MRFPILSTILASFALAIPAAAGELRHVDDAALRSVFFIDNQEGWIAGDEGVMLHTIDGGKRWERQVTGTRASLRSVQFLTPFVGWAVGREELPYGAGSVGVILFTNDGGLEWKRQLDNTLPGLNQVRFVDAKIGFLLGDGSDQFPAGVFKTTDSGRSWEPVIGARTTSWLTGDFRDSRTGILAGAWSRLATLKAGNVQYGYVGSGGIGLALNKPFLVPTEKTTVAEHADWLAGRDLTALQILGAKTIAVGQGGLILTSVSDGKAWGFADTKLPTKLLANLDFHTVAAVKDQIWIAGRPGSVILHSADGGANWHLVKTGQPFPLHSVFFFDEQLGWAVGDAGTIRASRDGGKTWAPQHQTPQRTAVMAIHSLNKNAPVDTVTLLGAAEGYLTAALRITAPDPAVVAWGRELDERRYCAAMRQAGALAGETLWHFPMPQHLEGCDKKTILAHWNQLHKGRAAEELLRQLVLSLRIWRPSVVVTEHPEDKTALSALLGEAVEEAVRRAADPKAYPAQIDELGLQAWKVRKIYGFADGKSPSITQDNDEPKERLQGSVREYAAAAQSLLIDRYTSLPKRRTHHHLSAEVGRAVSERHLLEGITFKPGEATREMKSGGKLTQSMAERRSVIEMAENLTDAAQALKLIPMALDKLPDESAIPTAFAIAGRFAEKGQWFLAQEFYLYQIDRSPAHPLSAEAYRWLLRFNSSGEARRRLDLKNFAVAEPLVLTHAQERLRTEKQIVQASHKAALGDMRDWNKGSSEWMNRLAGFGPIHAFEPSLQFCLQSAQRRLGNLGAANGAMENLRRFVPSGPWQDAARAELWQTDRGQAMPRSVGRARYTEVRPYLDGKFDDPCWRNLKPLILDNAVGATTKDYATEAKFAFDQEFLYVALKCSHPAGQRVEPVKVRPRDADLEAFDRVGILLDLDRDFTTCYHLEVDQRGCLRDSCWGDKNWNPRWFVAVHATETAWQIEAAIPLSELAGQRIAQNTAWAFNVVRVLPGRGVQSWSVPADVAPRPEGMSLLLFPLGNGRPMPGP